MSRHFTFWLQIASPHLAGLANSLVKNGHRVTFVVSYAMSQDRKNMGWQTFLSDNVMLLEGAESRYKEIVARTHTDTVHICAGLRANGYIRKVQKLLGKRGTKYWIILETVHDQGLLGCLRRLVYKRLIAKHLHRTMGFLAIGYRTADWLIARGTNDASTFPFAYFPNLSYWPETRTDSNTDLFKILFVGQHIPRKNFRLLLRAVSRIRTPFFLLSIGKGHRLTRAIAATKKAGINATFVDEMAMDAVPLQMSSSDCLVLPSHHDGWGAVISEALAAGTPVICSDDCGAAEVVRQSGRGGVFQRGESTELTRLLKKQIEHGKVSESERASIATWARCLGGDSGAIYLLNILTHIEDQALRPVPPWQSTSTS
jgi:glycosyltransferase involved in cell wall biosynthesis